MTTFDVPVKALRAARTHAATKDVRYYLCGVFFDLQNGRIVATDGHRMLVCEGPKMLDVPSFIMSNEQVDSVLKLAKGKKAPESVQVEVNGSEFIRVHVGESITTQKRIDGTFPDYVRVTPKRFTQETAQFNANYLADAFNALADYFGIKPASFAPRLEHNGSAAAVMHWNRPGCYAVIMPMRTDEEMNRDMAAFIDCYTDAPAAAA